jgi:hypothetical protein
VSRLSGNIMAIIAGWSALRSMITLRLVSGSVVWSSGDGVTGRFGVGLSFTGQIMLGVLGIGTA